MKYSPFTVDFHTHSIISYDGGLSESDYAQAIASGLLDYIAITDHNAIDFAIYMKRKLGDAIIIGEEIKTKEGEIIGLFLTKTISPKLSVQETIDQIHKQKGLVYVPHPFEKNRFSISFETFKKFATKIDIVESFNARSFGRKTTHNASDLAKDYALFEAASSDAHCKLGLGTAYSIIEKKLEKENISDLFKKAILKTEYAPLISYLCPAINKIKHKIVL